MAFLKTLLTLLTKDKIWFILFYSLAMLLLFSLLIFSRMVNINFGDLTRDPVALSQSHLYYGALSNIGIIIWSFSGSIALLTYILIRSSPHYPKKEKYFVLYAGFLSLLLLFDDLFLLHEVVIPVVFGIPEKIVYVLYISIVLGYLLWFRKIILQTTNYVFLALFLGFLALSVLIDLLPEYSEKWHYFFEDGTKFLGIVSWMAYQLVTAIALLSKGYSFKSKVTAIEES